jgi:hypothetical protein
MEYPQYVVLPQYDDSEPGGRCGHHFKYHSLLRITELLPGHEIRCAENCKFSCQRVIYKKTCSGAATSDGVNNHIPMRNNHIYAQTYNILRIMSGMYGLAYAN